MRAREVYGRRYAWEMFHDPEYGEMLRLGGVYLMRYMAEAMRKDNLKAQKKGEVQPLPEWVEVCRPDTSDADIEAYFAKKEAGDLLEAEKTKASLDKKYALPEWFYVSAGMREASTGIQSYYEGAIAKLLPHSLRDARKEVERIRSYLRKYYPKK